MNILLYQIQHMTKIFENNLILIQSRFAMLIFILKKWEFRTICREGRAANKPRAFYCNTIEPRFNLQTTQSLTQTFRHSPRVSQLIC